MSEFINKIEGLLAELDVKHQRDLVTQEMHEAQLKLYKEQSQLDREIVNDSIHLTERRWSGMRLFITSIVLFVLASGVGGGVAINDRPTKKDIEETYPTTEELFRGFGGLTDELYNDLEEYGVMSHEESEKEQLEAERKIHGEIDPHYKLRTIKKVK